MINGNRLRYHPYLHDDPPENELVEEQVVRRGSFESDPKGMYVEPKYVSFGDYGGSMVERSNYDEFMEEFAEHRGTEWWNWGGDYGSHGLIVRVDADERVPEIGEFFEGLEVYPLANEDRHSELEEEARAEAWEDYGEREFIDKLIELEPRLEEEIEEYSFSPREEETAFNTLRWAVEQAANESPIVEDAAGHVSWGPNMDVLERTMETDGDALMVAWELARTKQSRASGTTPLDYLFQELNSNWNKERQMPAFFYALMGFNPKAARYLGTIPNAWEFSQLWMEQELPDPELPHFTMNEDEAGWVEHAKALSKLISMHPEHWVSILGDLIEEGDMEKALQFLAAPPPRAKERKHGLE